MIVAPGEQVPMYRNERIVDILRPPKKNLLQ
jgi:hypothetical protein